MGIPFFQLIAFVNGVVVNDIRGMLFLCEIFGRNV